MKKKGKGKSSKQPKLKRTTAGSVLDLPEEDVPKLPRMSKEMIGKIAEDLFREKIFTDKHLGDSANTLLPQVFVPLTLMEPERIAPMIDDIGAIIEYYDKACQMAINGYPVFFSCQLVHKDDWKEIVEAYIKIKDAVEGAKKNNEKEKRIDEVSTRRDTARNGGHGKGGPRGADGEGDKQSTRDRRTGRTSYGSKSQVSDIQRSPTRKKQ